MENNTSEKSFRIKETIIRVLLLLVGLTIAHLGVTLFLLADLGADPFNVFIQGLHNIIAEKMSLDFVTHGITHMAVSIFIIFVLLLVDKSYIKIGTIICMFFGGPIIDLFTMLLGWLFSENSSFVYRLIFNAIGCAILAFGMTIVIKSEAGTGPNDLVAIVISDKTKKKFAIIRIIVDVLFVVVGFAFGGKFGAGTIVCAFLVGPVAGFFLPKSEKIVESIVGKLR